MSNESGSTIMPDNSPTSHPASPQSASCSQPSRLASRYQILTNHLPNLTKQAFLQDGIMAPSDVINLANYADFTLDYISELLDEIADLRQSLSDIQHTRQPYL